jgi:hypothetical protein
MYFGDNASRCSPARRRVFEPIFSDGPAIGRRKALNTRAVNSDLLSSHRGCGWYSKLNS